MTKRYIALFVALSLTLSLAALAGCTSNKPASVYLVKKATAYDSAGQISMQTEYSYAKNGCLVSLTRFIAASDYSEESNTYITYEGINEDGYPEKMYTSANGSSSSVSYEYQVDNNQVIKRTASDGSYEDYTYYPDGKLKTSYQYSETSQSSRKYDEDGYLSSQVFTSSSGKTTSDYQWKFDSQGTPTEVAVNQDFGSLNIDSSTTTFSLQCDENGNIVREYNEDGSLISEYEYTRIDNPCAAAIIESYKHAR